MRGGGVFRLGIGREGFAFFSLVLGEYILFFRLFDLFFWVVGCDWFIMGYRFRCVVCDWGIVV